MGVSAIPFDTVEKAKRFKKRMSKPWMAKVTKDKEFGYIARYSGRDLVGSDGLWDVMDMTAVKVKKDFDLRPFIKREVRAWLNVPDPTSQGDPIQAVNIVREVVGLPLFDPKRVASKTAPITFLKENGFPIRAYNMAPISKLPSWRRRIMKIEKFARMKDVYIFSVDFKSVRNLDEVKRVLKERFDVLSVTKISPWREKSRNIIVRMK